MVALTYWVRPAKMSKLLKEAMSIQQRRLSLLLQPKREVSEGNQQSAPQSSAQCEIMN